MIPLVALLIAAEAPSAPAPYPVEAVLAAFAAGCGKVHEPAQAEAAARQAGWRVAVPEPGSPIARLVAGGQAAVREDPEATILPGATMTREVAGRTLYLVFSGVRYDSVAGRGCRVYDFDAPAPLAPGLLTDWVGRAPSQSQSQSGVTRHVWNPGLAEGQMELEISFVAADAPVRAQPLFSALSGVALVATAMESSR